jgi:hypothetical protein
VEHAAEEEEHGGGEGGGDLPPATPSDRQFTVGSMKKKKG